jgi:hypothetical protein
LGTKADPHLVAMRSGTFNEKFTRGTEIEKATGCTMPKDWMDVILEGLAANL